MSCRNALSAFVSALLFSAGALVLALSFSAPASAHQADTSASVLTVTPEALQLDLTFSLTDLAEACGLDQDGNGRLTADEARPARGRLAACVAPHFALNLDHRPVEPSSPEGPFDDGALVAMLPAGSIAMDAPEHPSVTLSFHSPLERLPERAAYSARFFELLGESHAHIATVRAGGATQTAVLGPERPSRLFECGGTVPLTEQTLTFTRLGAEHIFIGYDHILFLLALILVGGGFGSLIRIVTAFTAAHSVTLALAALEIVRLPPRLVECGIALSIVYVAAENILVQEPKHRWVLTFCFGLAHGFGFAGVLAELGLPSRGLALALLAFNGGIELGQIAILALLFPVLLRLSKGRRYRRIVTSLSAAILLFGLGWFVERAAGLDFMPF